MFYCQITNQMSKPGEKPRKIVTQTRTRIYMQRVFNEETRETEDLQVGTGWEIVKEVNASERGQAMWDSWTDEQRQLFSVS